MRSRTTGVDSIIFVYRCGEFGEETVLAITGSDTSIPRGFSRMAVVSHRRDERAYLTSQTSGRPDVPRRALIALARPLRLVAALEAGDSCRQETFDAVVDSFLAVQDSDIDEGVYREWSKAGFFSMME